MDRTLILVKPDAFARGAERRDHRPLRAQGARDRGAAHMTVDPRAGRAPLRRARRAPVLRRARRLHHLRPDRGDGARGPRRGQGGAPGDRRDQPARGRAPARSAATSRSRWARTWCTARTRPSRRRASPRCSSASSPRAIATRELPLVLASGSPQRRELLARLGVPLHRPRVGRARSSSSGRIRPRSALENALRKARAALRPGARGGGARLRHDRRARRHDLRQARRRGAGARDDLARSAGARTR